MTDNGPVAIPHDGVCPPWLNPDDLIECHGNISIWKSDAARAFGGGNKYFLPADHWAAPVLRLRQSSGENWTPWNPDLQGEGPPGNYAGRHMYRPGGVENCETTIDSPKEYYWGWDGDDSDIIGYVATPATPRPEPAEPGLVEQLASCPLCRGPAAFDFGGEVGRWDQWDIECAKCELRMAGPLGAEGDAAKALSAEKWNTRASTTRIEQLEAALGEAKDHIREQIEHVETRIQDGIEMGATVWRIALEDIVRENRAFLSKLEGEG